MEDKYDPDGQISGFCRPILSHQRSKLAQILNENRDGLNTTQHESSIDAAKDAAFDPGFYVGSSLKKTVNMVQVLEKEMDASPSIKVRNRNHNKNEILEMTEKEFRNTKKSKRVILQERAFQLYEDQKEREGVNRKDVFKPCSMSHFHIEAFGD